MAAFEAWLDGLDFSGGREPEAEFVTSRGVFFISVIPKKLDDWPVRFDGDGIPPEIAALLAGGSAE